MLRKLKWPLPGDPLAARYNWSRYQTVVRRFKNTGLDHLSVEIPRSHTQPVGLLCTSDQIVAVAATYTKQNKYNRRTSMPSTEFEPTTASTELPQTYVIDRTGAVIGWLSICMSSIHISRLRGYWTAGVKSLRKRRVVTYFMQKVQNLSEVTVAKSSVFF
jgi:hypothetical protein